MGFLLFMLYRAPAVLLALTFHEVAHGYVALRCGDPTAKLMHRLSLNPIKHMDPIGTASMFLLGFGWAKPVPVNPNNFKRGRRDDLLVSLAGVTTNFILFLISTLLTVLVGFALYVPELSSDPQGMRFMLSYQETGYTLQLFPAYAGEMASLLKAPWLLHIQRFLLHFLHDQPGSVHIQPRTSPAAGRFPCSQRSGAQGADQPFGQCIPHHPSGADRADVFNRYRQPSGRRRGQLCAKPGAWRLPAHLWAVRD